MSDTVMKDEQGNYRMIPEKGGKLDAYERRQATLREAEEAIYSVLESNDITIMEAKRLLEGIKEDVEYLATKKLTVRDLREKEKREGKGHDGNKS